jgi:tetratricopeptide (TPR) repeat protein
LLTSLTEVSKAVAEHPDRIDRLIEQILTDAYGDEEQIDALVSAVADLLPVRGGVRVGGRPAILVDVTTDGWPAHPVVTYRQGGRKLQASLLSVEASPGSDIGDVLEAYRRWAGAKGMPQQIGERGGKARKEWAYPLKTVPESARAVRLVERLRARPLRLQFIGMWKPEDEYWGEPGDELEPDFEEIIEAGARPQCEMEQVIPGSDAADLDDAITLSADLARLGLRREAREMLRKLLVHDQRCIDAHAHLGNLVFAANAAAALVHYQTGVAIGEQALPPRYTGLLPWSLLDNRPFLRSLHGMGLCLWRLGRAKEAQAVFSTMLWLNPSDAQGERFNLQCVRDGLAWERDR